MGKKSSLGTLSGRRSFLRDLSSSIGMAAFTIPGLSAFGQSSASAGLGMSEPSVAGSKSLQSVRKLGVALVGLGKYSEEELAPALQATKQCQLAGIVTGTPEKAEKWKRKYGIADKNIYNYQTFDRIADNPDIDIVYVVLPNALHAEYVVRAAQAGKHVICEKPMATSVQDCQRMIDACQKAGKKLSIGYQLHFEPYNQEMMRLGQQEVYGAVAKILAHNAIKVEPGVWRLNRKLAGGGPLMDVGIYCVQGALYTKGQTPVAVTAQYHEKTDKDKFREVEQGIDFQPEFEDGCIAYCKTSYTDKYNILRAEATNGWFELEPAYAYEGLKGRTYLGKMDFPNKYQQAFQMDDFANCIANNLDSRVSGEMGLRDVRIMQAIYEAAETGRKVNLNLGKELVGNR